MDAMVDVMIFYTNNVARGTHTPYSRTGFDVGTSAVVVNCLFFGSLSASLLAALASVIALQWVADYDAAITRGGSSPEDRAKRRQFRYAGVILWKMNEIIAALPLLLYFSVMIFFAGLVLWMWDTNRAVGVVVATGTALAVLFYVASTMIAVAFVSAPFRTPLSRWIYTFLHLPFSVLYWLMQAIRISTIPDWVRTRHVLSPMSYRREDRAVERIETLGRDALIWLANQVSISQDSNWRLLLLVGELACLKVEHLPSFDSTEALWYLIFDLLGWRYLTRGPGAIIDVEERRRGMEILQRCYKLPVIQHLVDPEEREELTYGDHHAYWAQYCEAADDAQWMMNHNRPNHLFLLLRDVPSPSQFFAREIEVTSRLSQWRNQQLKEPHVWNEVLSDTSSLPSKFFSACVTTFGNYCSGEYWYLRDGATREIYKSLARKLVQIAILHEDLVLSATVPLIRSYEGLMTGYVIRRMSSNPLCLASPFRYGKYLYEGSADDHAMHEAMILLLARHIDTASNERRALQVKDVVTMLWLRPSNPVLRNWDYLGEEEQKGIDTNTNIMLDWIKNADSIPHIVEILLHLATAQKNDPTLGPLWRSTVPNEVNDPHFVDALQTLDRLMGMDCTGDDHCGLVNIMFQDLELEPHPNFDHYFTPSRLDALALLKDPCLQIIAGCARGPDFVNHVQVSEAYREARRDSLNRVAEYVYEKFSTHDSPAALQLQASLWPMRRKQSRLCQKAMDDTIVFVSFYNSKLLSDT
jgi:hypothetical protein